MVKSVPILKAKNFCRGDYTASNDTHCTMGWIYNIFKKEEDVIKVSNAYEQMFKSNTENIIRWNDNQNRKKSVLANTWNRIMKSLGYTKKKGNRLYA